MYEESEGDHWEGEPMDGGPGDETPSGSAGTARGGRTEICGSGDETPLAGRLLLGRVVVRSRVLGV